MWAVGGCVNYKCNLFITLNKYELSLAFVCMAKHFCYLESEVKHRIPRKYIHKHRRRPLDLNKFGWLASIFSLVMIVVYWKWSKWYLSIIRFPDWEIWIFTFRFIVNCEQINQSIGNPYNFCNSKSIKLSIHLFIHLFIYLFSFTQLIGTPTQRRKKFYTDWMGLFARVSWLQSWDQVEQGNRRY